MILEKLIMAGMVVYFILAVHCYPADLVNINGKWLEYNDSYGINLAVKGFNEFGLEETLYENLPEDEYFLNGYIYTHFLFDSYEWYACQVIHKKGSKYHVAGFAVFDVYVDDSNVHIDLTPSFLFNWGYDLKNQKFFVDIDYNRCPEIREDQIIPFSINKVREKYIYDRINGDKPDSITAAGPVPPGLEKFNTAREFRD